MTDDQHSAAPGQTRLDRASDSSTGDRPTDRSDASDSDTDDPTRPMTTTQLPRTATELFENNNRERSPIEDKDPQAALELLRDALVLLDSGAYNTALQRGKYEATITKAPEDWTAEYALHLLCATNTVVPDATEPGTTAQTCVTLWIHPVKVVREIVRDHLGADAFDGFTQKKEEEEEEGR